MKDLFVFKQRNSRCIKNNGISNGEKNYECENQYCLMHRRSSIEFINIHVKEGLWVSSHRISIKPPYSDGDGGGGANPIKTAGPANQTR